MSFPAYVAGRYLLSKGEPRFASFLTVVAVLGVAVGIAALIVVISVMSGFSSDLERKLIGFSPHVTVVTPGPTPRSVAERIKSRFLRVKEVEPFITGEVVVQAAGRGGGLSATGAKVYGLSTIPERMQKNAQFYWGAGLNGRLWWQRLIPPLERGVVLGSEMLYQVGVHPDFGDHVQLIAPFGGFDPFGNPVPLRREYRVVGGFKSGFFEYDMKHLLMSLPEAGRLLNTQGRYGLQIMLKESGDIEGFVRDLRSFLGSSSEVTGWTEKNRRLFAALKLERFAMTSLLFLIIIIASFSIIGVTLMIFFSKRRDLAVLMAMGASRKKVTGIFMFHGGWIGLAGAVLGLMIGLAGCYVISRSNIVLPPSYYLDYLPVAVDVPTVIAIVAGGVAISLLAALYPARRAAAIDPVALLRWE